MRVLMTTDTVGGVWSFCTTLCASLCGEHDVMLVSFGRALSPAQDAWVRGMRRVQDGFFSFEASETPLEWMDKNADAYAPGAALLAEIAERFRPDILHANQFCWGALPRQGALDVPRLVTAHSDVLSWAAACRSQGLEASAWLSRYRELVQAGLDGCDAVTAPTEWMLGELAMRFAVPARRVVILNGATLYFARGTRSEAPARKLQAVTAGRLWDEAKNLRLLLNVRSPLPMLVAGDEQFGDAEASAGEAVLAPAVKLLGPQEHTDLMQLFRGSALYICPSLYEPFGLAPLEAALCGCALLLYDLPSLREVWGEAALYFPDGAGLEVLLAQLASDPARIARTARQCSARAAELTADRMSREYAAAYQAAVHAALKDKLEGAAAYAAA